MGYKDYKIGNIVNVTVTGIQPYGVFATLDEETQGLIHISEVKHGYVENLKELFEIGEEIEAMILDIDEFDGRISLSLRTLQKAKYHPFSNQNKNPRYGKQTGIGFETLEEKLPLWIEVALNRIEEKHEK
ncbi:general stress protein 13 [Atopostipes suicloacalis DSM 15692]|uniref:General stress protein 13 n=1 Tax=Atopostipes suicloacalis DSM 15692 TaxID=1121025 RepID=A0A1M4Z1F0_9LACT|nr:CvfD/Ygs/GSP13 family RNA-binding post-transcriptional regulator [Atopostipes suicloacalis]SHF11820.1 general stress protein 13 [Atopostipes suicloacalis DSM 15692]